MISWEENFSRAGLDVEVNNKEWQTVFSTRMQFEFWLSILCLFSLCIQKIVIVCAVFHPLSLSELTCQAASATSCLKKWPCVRKREIPASRTSSQFCTARGRVLTASDPTVDYFRACVTPILTYAGSSFLFRHEKVWNQSILSENLVLHKRGLPFSLRTCKWHFIIHRHFCTAVNLD